MNMIVFTEVYRGKKFDFGLLKVAEVQRAINDICGGICETIGDLNRSLRSRYFASVKSERTSFAS